MNKISNFQFPIFVAAMLMSVFLPHVMQAITYDVILDTHDVAVNAVEGSLNLSEMGEVRSGDSAVVIWIKQPTVSGKMVDFAGITPGGFSGEVKLFSIDSEQSIDLISHGINAIKADGSGESTGVDLFIRKSQPNEKDITEPQPFNISFSEDENIFDGRRFAVFLSQDKESGIDHYEAAEALIGSPKSDRWIRVTSPYEIRDKFGIKKLYVKAVDKEGNFRIQQVSLKNRSLAGIILGIIIVVICALLVRRF